MTNVWIVRVKDGKNFRASSRFNMWGMISITKAGHKVGDITTITQRWKQGDILCFITSKPYGGKIIGIAEYDNYYERKEEVLAHVNTYSNLDAGWCGDDDWGFQITYKNLYMGASVDKHHFEISMQKAGSTCPFNDVIMNKFKDPNNTYFKCSDNVLAIREHYAMMKIYAEPFTYAREM
jgi:hypothetical protein